MQQQVSWDVDRRGAKADSRKGDPPVRVAVIGSVELAGLSRAYG